MSSYTHGLRAALPIAAAYVPVALALGAASTQLGFGPLQAALWSFIMYSGANQALLLSSVLAGTPLLVVTLLCAAASLRHALYGVVLAGRVPRDARTRLLFGYGLTDEVFATTVGADRLMNRPADGTTARQTGIDVAGPPDRLSGRWLVGLASAVFGVWVLSTGLGNLVGETLAAASPKVRGGRDRAGPDHRRAPRTGDTRGRAGGLPARPQGARMTDLWIAIAVVGVFTAATRIVPLFLAGRKPSAGRRRPDWLEALGPCLLAAMAVVVMLPALQAGGDPAGVAGAGSSLAMALEGRLVTLASFGVVAASMLIRRDPGLATIAGMVAYFLLS